MNAQTTTATTPDLPDDPAICAVLQWMAAIQAERSYSTTADTDWDDDSHAVALSEEESRLWQKMQDTPPTTAAGLALALAAFLYRMEGYAAGSQFHDPETWYPDGVESHGTGYLMLPALWRSPAAAELFRFIPESDRCPAERERSAAAFEKALAEAQKRPYDPNGYEVRGAMIASEAAGKPISEDEAIALLREHGRRSAA